jgi:hypothetical protein
MLVDVRKFSGFRCQQLDDILVYFSLDWNCLHKPEEATFKIL